jgi:hypothetical protein
MNLHQRISELEAALLPFATVARREELHGSTIGHADISDDVVSYVMIGSLHVGGPTMGEYRAAKSVLERIA